MTKYMELVGKIQESEGFRAKSYKDTLGKLTIGYGTLIEYGITKDEAFALLKIRLDKVKKQFDSEEHFMFLNENRKMVILEMGYQLGFNGVMKFRKMWKAIAVADFETASKEMLSSRWYEQTPNRARKLSIAMKIG